MDGPGHHEGADDGRRGQRSQQAQSHEYPGSGLGDTGHDRHGLARSEPEGIKEPSGAVESRTPKETEELLAAMADQQKTEDEPQHEQTCIHAGSLSKSETIDVTCTNIVDRSNIPPSPRS